MSLEELEKEFKEKLVGVYDAQELDKDKFTEVENLQHQIAEKYSELSDEELVAKKIEFDTARDEIIQSNNLKLVNNRATLPLSLEVLMTTLTQEDVIRNSKKKQ